MLRIVRQFANATSMARYGARMYSQRFCEFPHCAHHHGFIYHYYSFFHRAFLTALCQLLVL